MPSSTTSDVRVSEKDLISSTEVSRQRPLLLLQNLLTENTRYHSSLPSWCSSLLVRIDVLKHLDAIFNSSTPLSQLQNRHGLLRRSRLTFLSFKSSLLVNSKTMVQRELLIMVVQQLVAIFSTVSKSEDYCILHLGL